MAKVKSGNSQTVKQAKGTITVCIIIAVLFLLFAAFYAVAHWDYMVMGKTKDLNQATYSGEAPQENDYVNLNVRFVLGSFAETKHRINGFIPAGTDQHYAIVLEDGSIMALTIKNKSDIEKLEKLKDATLNFLSDENSAYPTDYLEVKGQISKMDKEINGYYHDALRQAGINTSNVTNIYDLTIDATESRFSQFGITGFLLLLCILSIIGAISSKKRLKKLRELQAIAKENAADPSLNPFLQQNQAAPEAAQQNPYMNNGYSDSAQQNPYMNNGYADNAQQNPYMNNGYADPSQQNPYMNNGYADPSQQNPYMNGAYTGDGTTPQDPDSGNVPPMQ